jgi:tRNA (cmo5U34)-methyltransferase
MIDVARARLGHREAKVELRVGDFRQLEEVLGGVRDLDVVYSSYALHHLTRDEKVAVLGQAMSLLRPGGWLVNADIIVAGTAALEERFQTLRVKGIVERAGAGHERFPDPETTRRFLDGMEGEEGDQPLALEEDLQVLRDARLRDVAVYWLEYREAVTGGRK